MITWFLQILVIAVVMLICLSDASVIVEYANGNCSCCNQTHDPCTDLQSALPKLRNDSKLIISAGDNYILSYDDAMTLYGMNSIAIVGEGSDNTVIMCDSNAGLAFINMLNITIANLTLKKCGAWRNSTTQNGTNNFTYKFRCGLYFLNCSDVTIYDVILKDGPGTGVMMYDVLGTVTIASSQFLHNRVPTTDREAIPGGGGVYIEFTYCFPNTVNFNACSPINQTNATYFIDNCAFINNTGTTINKVTTKYIFPIGSNHQQFGRGGGLSIHFKGNASNNSIIITNCTITDNMAVWGGGILMDFLDSAQNNHIVIKDVYFSNNSIYVEDATGGGALRINYFPQVESPSNIVNVIDCKFDSNSAYFGGAVSLAPKQEEQAYVATNRIYFNSCVWENNRAHIGSAIDLSSYFNEPAAGLLVFAVFKNCSFIRNGHIQINNKDLHIGMGTFHSDGISFSFEGENHFIKNKETALMIIHARAEFKENSSTEFKDNLGYRGGAMALLGNTWLTMERSTTVLFKNNSADDKGGAIYYVSAGVRDVNSRNCFIRYFDYTVAPINWKTKFTFIDNFSRNPGHAIYCTTLKTCSWNDTSIVLDPETLNNTFRWNGVFHYHNCTDDINTIATDPASVNISKKDLHIAPGNLSDLNLSVIDDTGATRNTVFFVHSDNKSVGNLASTSTYIADDQIKVLGSPGKTFPLQFYTTTTKVLSFKLNAILSKCPPGYYFPEQKGNASRTQCVCSVYDEKQRYNHIPYCRGNSFQAVLQPQFWAGYTYIDNDSVLVTGKCPSGYCYADGTKKLTLPSEANNDKINELICSPKNRSGVLCGHCENGTYIYANAKDYKCGKCTKTNGYMLQFFAKFLPLLIFLLIIVILDINLASGPLNTFVFFSQILPSLDLYAGGEIHISGGAKPFVVFYQFCYGIFNLQYFESLDIFPGWCTIKYESALSAAAMGYVDAFCPLVVIFLVWLIIFASDYCVCCESERNVIRRINTKFRQLYRRIKPNGISLSKSFFRGLVTFILLSYTKFTLVTLTLLTPAYLHGPGGKTLRVVASLDGTLEFFGSDHRHYAEPAILYWCLLYCFPWSCLPCTLGCAAA